LKYRNFGTTGWKVSEISFGGWQLGGQWGEVDDAASIRTLLHAYSSGINFVDTAELYGNGHSEKVIGESLRQWSGNKIYVATKVQPTVWPDPDDDMPLMRGRYPAWHLRDAVEQSLRRLGVERIDLFQLHGWFAGGIGALDWLETVSTVIPGMKDPGEVDKNIAYSGGKPFPAELLAQLAEHNWPRNYYK
jgi:aryl-alcohol dehydrogenase-like predicted oxidoreductase